MFKLNYFIAFLFFITYLSINAQDEIDVVYLKNGSIIKGKIIEQVPNQSIKIKTSDGSIFVYKFDEIEKMVKENLDEDNEPYVSKKPQTKGFLGTFSGGIGIPLGDLGDSWLISYNFGVSGGYVLSNSVGARMDIGYNSFALDASTGISGGRFTIITLRGDFLFGDFNKKSNVIPYGLLGLGIYFKSVDDIKISGLGTLLGDSESEFGIAVGGGVGIKISKNVAIFGELQYNHGFGSGTVSSFIPIKAGIMLTP